MDTLNTIISNSFNWIWAEFLVLIGLLTSGWAGVVILVFILIVFATLRKFIKILVWQKVFDAISAIVGILLAIIIGLHIYWFISALPNSGGSSSGSSGTKSTTPSTNSTPSTQTTPQTQKQLYYTTSCYNCWAESCPRNGYSYGGYSETNYLYYKSLCDQCSCNDKKSQSFWK